MDDAIVKDLYKRISSIEDKIARRNNAPTIPVYDSTNFPQDAVRGQIVKDQNHDLWVYGEDDAWHKIGGGFTVDNAFYHANNPGTHSTRSQYFLFDLEETTNPSLFDTSSGYPRFLDSGIFNYWTLLEFVSGGVGVQFTTASASDYAGYQLNFAGPSARYVPGFQGIIYPFTNTVPLQVSTMQFNGTLAYDVSSYFNTWLDAPANSVDVGDVYLYIERIGEFSRLTP